jgi:hypothetical protein
VQITREPAPAREISPPRPLIDQSFAFLFSTVNLPGNALPLVDAFTLRPSPNLQELRILSARFYRNDYFLAALHSTRPEPTSYYR